MESDQLIPSITILSSSPSSYSSPISPFNKIMNNNQQQQQQQQYSYLRYHPYQSIQTVPRSPTSNDIPVGRPTTLVSTPLPLQLSSSSTSTLYYQQTHGTNALTSTSLPTPPFPVSSLSSTPSMVSPILSPSTLSPILSNNNNSLRSSLSSTPSMVDIKSLMNYNDYDDASDEYESDQDYQSSGNTSTTTTTTKSINSIRPLLSSSPNSSGSGSNSSSNGIYFMMNQLLPLCQEIDTQKGASLEKTKNLDQLLLSMDSISKKIKRMKKSKLPHAPKIEKKLDFIQLRPRRNRKSKNMYKVNEDQLQCSMCGTSDTPEWRRGPDGCKSLCNACGLYFAKTKKKERDDMNTTINHTPSSSSPTSSPQHHHHSNTPNNNTNMLRINSIISDSNDK